MARTRNKTSFKKGHKKLGGRSKNTPNKATVMVKEVIEGVAEKLGGLEGMYRWVKRNRENERIFWAHLYPKLLPIHLQHSGSRELLIQIIKREELATKLQERGLPSTVFGAKVPMLELKANEPEGKSNGHAKQNGSAAGSEGGKE